MGCSGSSTIRAFARAADSFQQCILIDDVEQINRRRTDHSLELKGKVVLLDFWGTFCAPCRDALPSLRTLAKRHAGEPFTMVALSADLDEEAWRGASW